MFPSAVVMLRTVIDEEGNAVLAKATAQQKDLKLKDPEPKSEAEPSFENPIEDMIPLELRRKAISISIVEPNGDIRMPFPAMRMEDFAKIENLS